MESRDFLSFFLPVKTDTCTFVREKTIITNIALEVRVPRSECILNDRIDPNRFLISLLQIYSLLIVFLQNDRRAKEGGQNEV